MSKEQDKFTTPEFWLLYKAKKEMYSVKAAAKEHKDFADAFAKWKNKEFSDRKFLPFLEKYVYSPFNSPNYIPPSPNMPNTPNKENTNEKEKIKWQPRKAGEAFTDNKSRNRLKDAVED
jgi:hypothetical protein